MICNIKTKFLLLFHRYNLLRYQVHSLTQLCVFIIKEKIEEGEEGERDEIWKENNWKSKLPLDVISKYF